ncbi:MAG: RlmE family RNA methyltransferase [Geminicoccaceae bacterium]
MTTGRNLKTRLKTARGRTVSSQRWLERQLNDPYVQKARQEGWRARSVFKLQELDERFALLKRGARVLDLGAAPGSWSQYAARKGCRVVAVDLQPVAALAGVELIEGDFLDPLVQAELRARLGGPADLVLSDMAASATGQRAVDRLRAEGLGEAVLDFATEILAPGGACALKLVKGGEAVLMARAQTGFASAKVVRPKATRADSSEVFLVARGFKGRADEPA